MYEFFILYPKYFYQNEDHVVFRKNYSILKSFSFCSLMSVLFMKGILHVVLQLLWEKSRSEIHPRRGFRLERIQKAFEDTDKCFSLLHQIVERFIKCDQAISWSCRYCSWNWHNCYSWLWRVLFLFCTFIIFCFGWTRSMLK